MLTLTASVSSPKLKIMMNSKPAIRRLIIALSAVILIIGGFFGITAVKKSIRRHNTLVFYFSPGVLPEEEEGFLLQVNQFRKENPSLRVDLTPSRPQADIIFTTHSDWINSSPMAPEDRSENSPLKGISPQAFPAAVRKAFSRDSRLAALPLLGSPLGLYYNKALLSKTGEPLPERWQPFLSLLERTIPEQSLPLLLPEGSELPEHPAYQYLAANSSRSSDPADWDSYREEWEGLILKGLLFTPSLNQPRRITLQSLLQDEALFLLETTSLRRLIETSEQIRLGFAPIPTLTGRPAYLPARLTGLAPTSSGMEKKHGASLMAYFSRAAVQEELATRSSLQGYTYLYALHRQARLPHREARTVSRSLYTAAGIIPAE